MTSRPRKPTKSFTWHGFSSMKNIISSRRVIAGNDERKLPKELLIYIFTLCVEPFATQPFDHTWRTPAFPISQVCRLWREVALDMPSLWSILPIRLDPKPPSSSYEKFLNTVMKRSTGEIWIKAYQRDRDVASPIIDLLAEHAERWCGVVLHASPRTLAAFSRIKHRLPRLRFLRLDLCTARTPGDEATIVDCFSDAPSLREVHLRGSHPMLMLPWIQFEVFGCETVKEYPCEHRDIFRYANGPGNYTTLPILTSLHLKFPMYGTWGAYFKLLDRLTLPSLRELKLVHCPESASAGLIRLLSRSTPSLHLQQRLRVHVDSSSVPVPILPSFQFLRQVPHLGHLEIELKHLWHIITGMQDPVNKLIPELKGLIVHWDKPDGLGFERNYDVLNDLAESRCEIECREEFMGNQAHVFIIEPELTHFLFVFKERKATLTEQSRLNLWSKYNNAGKWTYIHWEELLQQILSDLDQTTETHLNPELIQRLDQVLEQIESTIKSPQDVCLFYASKIHFSVQRLSWQYERLGDFHKRVMNILDIWSEAIRADTSDIDSPFRKKWVLKGRNKLQYIPRHHDIHISPQSSQLIWGLEDDTL